jgi:hypothetical protein
MITTLIVGMIVLMMAGISWLAYEWVHAEQRAGRLIVERDQLLVKYEGVINEKFHMQRMYEDRLAANAAEIKALKGHILDSYDPKLDTSMRPEDTPPFGTIVVDPTK